MAHENKYNTAETKDQSDNAQKKEARRAKEMRSYQRMKIRNRRKEMQQDKVNRVSIIALFALLLLAVCTISVLVSGEPKTFYSLLLMLQDVPSIDFGWLDFGEVVLNLPEWLSWLEVAVQFLAEVVQVFGFFLAGIGQALLFVLYFLRWVFL